MIDAGESYEEYFEDRICVLLSFGSSCIEACAVFQEDEKCKADFSTSELWEIFGGWEHFIDQVSWGVLYNNLDKISPYISEKDYEKIEFSGFWYEDLKGEIPEELYDKICCEIDELYDETEKDFDKFAEKFTDAIFYIYREIEEIDECSETNEIPVKYGIDWDEINIATEANDFDIHFVNMNRDKIIIEFPETKWLFNKYYANEEHDINTWVNNTYGNANNMILALEVK